MKTLQEYISRSLNFSSKDENILEDQDFIFEMANLSKDETKLPMTIWIESNVRSTHHNKPRMKFANSYSPKQNINDLIPISIDKENPEILIKNYKLKISSKDLDILKDWIKKHYENLIKVWNQDMTPFEFAKSLE